MNNINLPENLELAMPEIFAALQKMADVHNVWIAYCRENHEYHSYDEQLN